MASTNFKLFDENKVNIMSDTEYNIASQRLNGVQTGIASSQLQNKTLYQTSLVAYSLAQIMMQNGYDANDSAAVSAFVGNMSNSLLQKVLDKATSAEVQAGTITNKWISPATLKAAALLLSGGTMSGPINMGNNKITNLADPADPFDSVNKKYVDENSVFKKIKIIDNSHVSIQSNDSDICNFTFPSGFTENDMFNVTGIKLELKNVICNSDFPYLSFYSGGDVILILKEGTYPLISITVFNFYLDPRDETDTGHISFNERGSSEYFIDHKIGTNTGTIRFFSRYCSITFDLDVYFLM